MQLFIGIDIAKQTHWACAIDRDANVIFSMAIDNDPPAITGLIERIEALGANHVTVALDMLGGMASLVCAMIGEAGFRLVHTPGLAVNRARQGIRSGETKSDPKDAAVIAELARTRPDLRTVEPVSEIDADIRLLVSRRKDLVADQTRRAARIRDMLGALFPALERLVDPTTKTGLVFLTQFANPEEIRVAGERKIVQKLNRVSSTIRNVQAIAAAAVAAAREQMIDIPGAAMRTRLVKELAEEALAAKVRIAAIDKDLKALLDRHPDGALIQSLPGMGAVLTAEFIALAGNVGRFRNANALAAAAGLAPVLRQSGKSRATRRAYSGDKALKRVFYQAAFTSLANPDSRAFYDRKRAEGKRHHQAVIALARRRVNVLWAIVSNRTPYATNFKNAA
ncbi:MULTISPECIES: IS110 family transposase [unclassified Roseitalea]|uniref:IS110 family transposase n=1 Tax=unclassified Roseitalea TaxID=2639107 RepID=UPI00273EADA5|nr:MULTISPECIES: IS110 family transposase [unclassified Roseitalea]